MVIGLVFGAVAAMIAVMMMNRRRVHEFWREFRNRRGVTGERRVG